MMTQFTYPYPRPSVTATVALIHDDGEKVSILLGKRKSDSEAFAGYWCLPGGFLNAKTDTYPGETVKDAAIRELHEETGIKLKKDALQILDEYSNPETDPRGHVVNIAFFCFVERAKDDHDIKAGDDISELKWVDIYDNTVKSRLAFNHAEIVEDVIEIL